MSEKLESEKDTREVTLLGGDGKAFTLPFKAAIQSVLVKDTLSGYEEEGVDEDEEGDDAEKPVVYEPIEMQRVSSSTLEKIVDFLKHHDEEPINEIPHPLPADTFEQVRCCCCCCCC